MLESHLNPGSDRASRRHEQIDRSAQWLVGLLGLTPGRRVLDLGCGPGLYATRLARLGIEVLGVDVSSRSLDHQRAVAARENVPVRTVHGSYLPADLAPAREEADGLHDAVLLIFEDYSVLSPAQRSLLLERIRDALRPGGQLVFDVTSAAAFAQHHDGRYEQQDLMDGFWAPRPYRGLHETWTYPELRLVLDRYTITTGSSTRRYWNWMHCLGAEQVAAEVRAAGFTVLDLYGDVTGARYDELSPTLAVHAQRPDL